MAVGINAGAQGVADELGAEADAERGLARSQEFFDEAKLFFQEGIAVLLIHAHGAAHYDQGPDSVGGRGNRSAFFSRDQIGGGEPSLYQGRGEGSEMFVGDVAEDE